MFSLTRSLDQPGIPPETLIETLSILSILITRFPGYLADPNLQPQPLTVLTPLLSHTRPAVRKRAISTLAQFLPLSQSEHFTELLRAILLPNLAPSAGLDKQRTTVQLVAAVGRHSPHQIAPYLNDLVPGIIKAISKDDEELRESGLQVCCFVPATVGTHGELNFIAGARSPCSQMSGGNYTFPRKCHPVRDTVHQVRPCQCILSPYIVS